MKFIRNMSDFLRIFSKDDAFLGFIPLKKKKSNLVPKLSRVDTKQNTQDINDKYLMIDDRNNLNEADED